MMDMYGMMAQNTNSFSEAEADPFDFVRNV